MLEGGGCSQFGEPDQGRAVLDGVKLGAAPQSCMCSRQIRSRVVWSRSSGSSWARYSRFRSSRERGPAPEKEKGGAPSREPRESHPRVSELQEIRKGRRPREARPQPQGTTGETDLAKVVPWKLRGYGSGMPVDLRPGDGLKRHVKGGQAKKEDPADN